MDSRMSADLDRYITGNYGEDQFADDWILDPAPEQMEPEPEDMD